MNWRRPYLPRANTSAYAKQNDSSHEQDKDDAGIKTIAQWNGAEATDLSSEPATDSADINTNTNTRFNQFSKQNGSQEIEPRNNHNNAKGHWPHQQTPQRKGPSLKNRALRLLTLREHSRPELERKLAVHEEQAGQLALVLDDLEAKGFISEERVVASVVYRRSSKLGAKRVGQELQHKGISQEAVKEAVAELQTTELDRARAVWLKKFGQTATTPKEKAKQLRFLISRGFSTSVLYEVLGTYVDDFLPFDDE
jgi:regulatory protein